MRQPVRCKKTGLWLARYADAGGSLRQAGRFYLKRDAQRAIARATERVERQVHGTGPMPTLLDWMEIWQEEFPRAPRTMQTNLERVDRYVLPYLPRNGHEPLDEIRRAHLRAVQGALLRKGLAKETIDGVFAALSAMLRDAVDDELVEANVAHAFRVRRNDPRLNPIRPKRRRRSVPPEELARFFAEVEPRHRALCWAPLLTGVRPGELFALRREEIDRERHLIYVHETVDRYGKVQAGTKTTHHVREHDERGRWTLFPPSLLAMVDQAPASLTGYLFATPRGKLWGNRHFYRDVWDLARNVSLVDVTLYDMRHTFSSRLYAAGIPLVEISAWMGHSIRAAGREVVNTTSRMYMHPTGEHTEAALVVMDELVARCLELAEREAQASWA